MTNNTQPYATVILPTHDRYATLPIALRSGLAQTVNNIEIIIALDGATQKVRDVATTWANKDPRIRILDLPKSPLRCGTTREAALAEAKSERIFVLQDDDLWFPDQIEVMGRYLDDHDLVTSATLAATLSGSLAIWPCVYSDGGFRKTCMKNNIKLIYEAHFAFRRSSYYRYGVNWGEQRTSYGHTKRLLNVFCSASDVRCASVTKPTSLSLNSPPRAAMSQQARADEMLTWAERLESKDSITHLIERANLVWPLYVLTRRLPPDEDKSLYQYIRRFGLTVEPGRQATISESGEAFMATSSQRQDLEAAWSIFRGQRITPTSAAKIIGFVVDSVEGHEPAIGQVGNLLINAMGIEDALESAKIACTIAENSRQKALCHAVTAFVLLRAGDTVSGLAHIKIAEELCADPQAYFLLLAGHLAKADGQLESALKYYEASLTILPQWTAAQHEVNITRRLLGYV